LRHLVLSDLHANLEALEAVLADVATQSWDSSLVLGDLVGYGADPNPVLDRLRDFAPDLVIRGNHDKFVAGLNEGEGFNPLALASGRWTREVLRPDLRDWLAGLPQGPCRAPGEPRLFLSHGSPLDEEAYVLGIDDALSNFEGVEFLWCLFGHTHYPVAIGEHDDGVEVRRPPTPSGGEVPLTYGRRYLINPGAIGQPRDGNPRASYLILDTETSVAEFRRVPYRVELAMAKIIEAGLPAPLAARLPRGV
jgi:diadenosine tetraphosphatase ApaH/serine/threonine PP2A family protein phosphatase